MSLNFGGINIGGNNSGGGGGGGTTNHAALSNLDYASSGHTGFLKDDASNLTANGQKVFDGQWVSTLYTIQESAVAETEGREYDISEALPDDNYNYEVMVRAWANTGTTSGNQHQVALKSDILQNQAYACGATSCGGLATATSTVIIPVGTQRKLIMQPYPSNTGRYGMAIIAYRRIGTNV